ncbi:unnamed protein product, partial [Brassica rapa]
VCADGHPRTSCVSVLSPRTNVLICVLMDSHERLVCADGHTRTATMSHVLWVLNRQPTRAKITRIVHGEGQHAESKDQRADMCTDGQPQTHGHPVCADGHTRTTNVLICVLMDSHRRLVCADGHTRTATDDLCVLTDTHGRPVCADGHPQLPGGAKSPEQSTGRASMLSPKTNVLICVLMDGHGRPVCADGHTRTHRQPRTSCVCWRTPTDVLYVLCVLNRQPTRAKITRIVHGEGQRAESKDQRADMCTDGQPQTSCVPRGPKSPEQSTGRSAVLSPRTNVLICVLMDSHRRPVCADGYTRTQMDSHGHPVCADGHTRTSCPTWAKITQTVHRKGQRAEFKDQRADMSTDVLCVLTDTHGHTWTGTDILCVLTDTHGRHVPHGPKSPKQSTGRVSVLSSRTNVLICVLMDSHRRPVCADGHTRTATDDLCVLTDTHGRPVCADGHTRTSCVC